MRKIAEALLAYRKKHGLTQIEMTRLVGCSYATYRQYEQDVMQPVSYLERIMELLDEN